MFQWSSKGFSKRSKEVFKEISKGNQVSFKDVSRDCLKENFKEVSNLFQ